MNLKPDQVRMKQGDWNHKKTKMYLCIYIYIYLHIYHHNSKWNKTH